MHYEDDERDPFEAFGEMETAGEDPGLEFELMEEARGPEQAKAAKPAKVKTPFSWAGFTGGFAALLWVGAAIGGPLSYYGLDAVMTMDPAMQAAMIALAFGPALLFWVAASAAGEAMKARKLAADLAQIARESRLPIEAGAADAKVLGSTVRSEIEALTDAVAGALDRLAELEHSAKRSALMFGEAVDASRENAELMARTLRDERDALADINGDLRSQTEAVANSIGRQVRLMREASKIVKTEITAAEDALQTHLTSFAASAHMIGERTAAFHHAADQAAAATTSLHTTMATMLEGLSEATRLADTAKKSSEQAVMAANETAGALRETTRSAVFEAKRAAQLIRAETQAMQESAVETLVKLQEAAHAARAASQESQAEADRHAASVEQRLASLAKVSTRGASPSARTPEQSLQRPMERLAERTLAEADLPDLRSAASAALARGQSRPQERAEPRRGAFRGFGSWGNFMPQTPAEETPAAANEDLDLLDFSTPSQNPDEMLKDNALDLVTECGVDLEDVLAPRDLDRIARRSRDGAAARRAAVVEAAPSAVTRIARHVKRNNKAHLVANEFRARPDLAKSENKSESSDLVRAYLLIDAALA